MRGKRVLTNWYWYVHYKIFYFLLWKYFTHIFSWNIHSKPHKNVLRQESVSYTLCVPFPQLGFGGGDILITPVWGFVNQTSFLYTFKSSIIAVMRKMYQYTQCRRAKKQSYPSHVIFWIENHDLYSLSCREASFWKGKKNHTLIKSHI